MEKEGKEAKASGYEFFGYVPLRFNLTPRPPSRRGKGDDSPLRVGEGPGEG
ncbi:hypothetical protein HYR99_31585 [Candidatus Poribacteria bacterium]|nr:hypothetical protein [Candidatus Poribacteria bacterium]